MIVINHIFNSRIMTLVVFDVLCYLNHVVGLCSFKGTRGSALCALKGMCGHLVHLRIKM